MNPANQHIKVLFADLYHEAALGEVPMERLVAIVEPVKRGLLKEEGFYSVLKRIDQQLGFALEEQALFDCLKTLQQKITDWRIAHIKQQVEQNNANGWSIWLNEMAAALGFLRNDILRGLLNLNVEVTENNEFTWRTIQQLVPFVLEESWADGYDLYLQLADHAAIDPAVSGQLWIIAAHIQIYVLLNFEQARIHLREAENLLGEESTIIARNWGLLYVQDQDFEAGRKWLEKALDLGDEDDENYLAIGDLYKAQKQQKQAANWYEKGLQLHPGRAEYYNRFIQLCGNGDLSYNEVHLPEIDRHLETINRLDADYWYTAVNNAGYAYQVSELGEKALSYYHQLIDNDPGRYQAYISLGYYYLDQPNVELTEKYFNDAIALSPKAFNGFEGYWGRVALRKHQKSWEAALEDLRMCEILRPSWSRFIRNEIGFVYEQMGQIGNAEAYYLSALSEDPSHTIGLDRLQEIATEYGKDDVQRAIALYHQIREIIGDSYEDEFQNRVGVLYHNQGDFEKAIEYYQRAIECKDNDPIYFENIGLAHERLGRIEEAAGYYEQAVASDPTNSAGYLNRLGVLWHDHGELEKALGYYNQAIAKEEKALYFENRGLAWQRLDQIDRAEADFNKAIEVADSGKDVYQNRLAFFHINNQAYEKAIALCLQAISLNPDPNYYENLGYAYEHSGQQQAALDAYQQALEKATDRRDVYLNRLGVYHYNLGQHEKAISFYQEAINEQPEKPIYHDNLGLAYEKNGELALAKDAYQKAGQLSDDEDGYYENLIGLMYYRNGQTASAIPYYQAAIETKPEAVYYENLGLAYEKLHQYQEAESAYWSAIQLPDDQPQIYLNRLGFFLGERQRYEEAIPLFIKALEHLHSSTYAENLGFAYEQLGQHEAAAENYQHAIDWAEGQEEKARYFNRMGVFYYNRGTYDLAIDHYLKAIESQPKTLYYENLARAYELNGQVEDLEKTYLYLHENEPDRGEYLYYLGDYFVRRQGELSKGIPYLEKALSLFLATPEVEPEEAEIYDFFQDVGFLEEVGELESLLTNRVKSEHENHILRLFLGNWYFGQQQFEEAVVHYQKALELVPTLSVYSYKYAHSLVLLRQDERALSHFESVAVKDPSYRERIAKIFFDNGAYDHAEHYMRWALESQPENYAYWENLALIQEYKGEFEEAAANYKLAFEKAPVNLQANYLNLMGNMAYRQGKLEEALEAYREAISQNPNKPVFYENMALMYEKQEEYELAIYQIKKAIQLVPNEVSYIRRLGELFQLNGELTLAIDQFKQVLHHNPDQLSTLDLLAKAYIDDGQWEEAEVTYQHAISVAKVEDRDIYHNLLGNLYYQMEAFEAAIDQYEQAIALRNDIATYYDNEALMYESLHVYDKAIELLAKAAKLAPQNPQYTNRIGILWLRLGQSDQAIDAFLQSIEKAPSEPESYEYLGRAYYDQERYTEAIQHIEKAAEVAPLHQKGYYLSSLGAVYREMDHFYESKVAYQRAISYSQPHQQSPYYYGIALACRGLQKYDEAIDALQQAIDLELHEKDVYLNYLGLLYLEMGIYEEARQQYEAAIQYYPKQPIYYDNLAYTYEMLGDVEAAERAYHKALNLSPNNGLYYYRLGDLQRRFYNNHHKALGQFIKAVELSPNHAMFLKAFIDSVFQIPDKNDQLRFLKRAQAIPDVDHLMIRDAMRKLKGK